MNRKLMLLVVVVLVLAAGGAVLYINRPSAVAERALATLAKATTADFSARLNVANSTSTQQLLGEEGTVDIGLQGQWKREDGPDSVATHVALTTQTPSVSVKIEGEVRLIADKIYWQITTTPQAFPALVRLKDQWVMIGRDEAPKREAAADRQKPVLADVRRVGVESIGGVSTVHYKAVASEQTMIAFMDGLAEVLGTSLSQAQIDQIKTSVAKVQSVPLDIWVPQWGNEPKQLRVSLAVPDGNTVQFTLTFDSLNKPVKIAAPAGAKTLQEIAQQSAAQ